MVTMMDFDDNDDFDDDDNVSGECDGAPFTHLSRSFSYK